MNALGTAEYADARGRPITYVDVPFDQRRDQELGKRGLSEHHFEHFLSMARLDAAYRYDRHARGRGNYQNAGHDRS